MFIRMSHVQLEHAMSSGVKWIRGGWLDVLFLSGSADPGIDNR